MFSNIIFQFLFKQNIIINMNLQDNHNRTSKQNVRPQSAQWYQNHSQNSKKRVDTIQNLRQQTQTSMSQSRNKMGPIHQNSQKVDKRVPPIDINSSFQSDPIIMELLAQKQQESLKDYQNQDIVTIFNRPSKLSNERISKSQLKMSAVSSQKKRNSIIKYSTQQNSLVDLNTEGKTSGLESLKSKAVKITPEKVSMPTRFKHPPKVIVSQKLMQKQGHRRNPSALCNSMAQPETIQQAKLDLKIQGKQESDMSPQRQHMYRDDISPVRFKQRAKSSFGVRPSRNSQVNTQMTCMLQSLSKNPHFNNYLLNNDFQNMTSTSKEKLLGFHQIYNTKRPVDFEESQVLLRKKSKKKATSMTQKQIQDLIRQNKNLSQKYNQIADKMINFMNSGQIPNQRELRDQAQNFPSDQHTNPESTPQGLHLQPGNDGRINNTGSLNNSANIYYNRIQNVTINARGTQGAQECLENFVSNNPQNGDIEQSQRNSLPNAQRGQRPIEINSPLSYNLPNIQIFSFKDESNGPTNTGRVKTQPRKRSANVTNKAEVDELPILATNMSNFLNQNIESINPSKESDRINKDQIRKIKDISKKRATSQLLEDDIKIQRLLFAMRNELEQKRHVYGDERLQVLQHAIDKIMGNEEMQEDASQDTFQLLNHPIMISHTPQENRTQQKRQSKQRMLSNKESCKVRLKDEIISSQKSNVQSPQNMMFKGVQQELEDHMELDYQDLQEIQANDGQEIQDESQEKSNPMDDSIQYRKQEAEFLQDQDYMDQTQSFYQGENLDTTSRRSYSIDKQPFDQAGTQTPQEQMELTNNESRFIEQSIESPEPLIDYQEGEESPFKLQNIDLEEDSPQQFEEYEVPKGPTETQNQEAQFNHDELYLLGMLDFMDQEKQPLVREKLPFEEFDMVSNYDSTLYKLPKDQLKTTQNFKLSKFEPASFKYVSSDFIDLGQSVASHKTPQKSVQNLVSREIIGLVSRSPAKGINPDVSEFDIERVLENREDAREKILTRDHSIGFVNSDIDQYDMQERELRVEEALELLDDTKAIKPLGDTKITKKFKNPIKLERDQIVETELKEFEHYSSYQDMVWNRKNNKAEFIIFDNDQKINTGLTNISFFDIQSNTNNNKVYDQISWDMLQREMARFEGKYKDIDNIDRLSPEIDKFLDIFMEEYHLYQECHYCLQDNLLKIPKSDMNVLKGQFSDVVRVLPIVLKYKIGLYRKALNNYTNTVVFNNRMEHLMTRFNFAERHVNRNNFIQDVEHRQHMLGLRNELKEYTSMLMIDINNRYSFNELMFKHQTTSLYNLMYDRSQDYVMNQMFDNLYTQQKEICIKSLLHQEGYQDKDSFKVDRKHLMQMILNGKKSKTWDHPAYRFNLLDDVIAEMSHQQKECPNSDRDGDIQKPSVRPFIRQDALNSCSYMICELQVIMQLDKILLKSKDSMHMMYNRIETLINKDDQDYSNIFHLFGYKCNYIRNPDNTKYLMEVYIPILKKDGVKKIRRRRNVIEKQLKSQPQIKSKYTKNKQERAQNKLKSRFKQMLMVEDYDTDESMKGIDFQDIKEDQSDDEDAQKLKKKHSVLEKLGDFCSPIEHYQQLKKEREKRGDCSRKSSQHDFDFFLDSKKNYKAKYVEELENSNNKVNPMRFLKNKNKIEVMIMQTQANIIAENIEEAEKIKSSNEYIRKVRKEAVEHFGSLENYHGAKQGRVLEDNLLKLEMQIQKSVKELENQNYRLQKVENEESQKKKLKRMGSIAEDKDSREIVKKIQDEDDDRVFLVNNEINILKAIQTKKKENRESKKKQLDAKIKLLNLVNENKRVARGAPLQKKETDQVKAMKIFKEQLALMYQENKDLMSKQSTLESQHKIKAKDRMFNLSINLIDTIKSSNTNLQILSPKKKCTTVMDKTHQRFRRRMFQAIENSNVGLMKDVIDRYTHQDEYNSIVDFNGNTLLCLAALHGDHEMIKLLIESGFDPNLQNHAGDTPLHHAIAGKKIKCVDLLIQKGVNERIKNDKGQLAWELS